MMRAAIVFTGTGPILVLTKHDSFENPVVVEKLIGKGLKKFIARELPIDKVKERYGTLFSIVMGDRHQTDDLRVLDQNGTRILQNFAFEDMGEPVYYDERHVRRAA